MHKITEKQRNNLLEAARQIEANPEHFDMGNWICGTTACIAGWAVMVDQNCQDLEVVSDWWRKLSPYSERMRIRQATGLKPNTEGKRLFMDCLWIHCPASVNYYDAWTHEEKATAAADYVRWFVENHTTT